jgi:hypothetical protein
LTTSSGKNVMSMWHSVAQIIPMVTQ